nr:unnamed protein product [Digitaria exilis]
MVTSVRLIVGIIGSVVCVLLYAVPVLTFKRVIKEASVGEFSCIPYILTLFSALTWGWYGFPVKFVILMLSLVLAIISMIVFLSIYIFHTHHMRKLFVGSIGIVTSMSMLSSPLVAVKEVMKTKSVEFMPFYLSLFSLLTSLIWVVYGILGRDPYIMAPNGVGCLTGILQLVVYCIYSGCREPPKTLDCVEQINDLEATTIAEDANG